MRRYVMMALVASSLLFSGCAAGTNGVSAPLGAHGKESILSDNKIEGLYLFKIETNQNNITVNSGGDAKVGM